MHGRRLGAGGRPRRKRLVAAAAACLVTLASTAAGQAASQSLPRRFEWPTGDEARRPPPRLILLSTPQLELGTDFGPDHLLFAGVVGAVRDPAGSLIIADAGWHRVVRFDRSGQVLRTSGREGDGPGEFRLPRWLGRCDDGRLALHDAAHQRVSHISPDGQLGPVAPLPTGLLAFEQMVWCSGQGSMLFLQHRLRRIGKRGPDFAGERLQVPTSLVRVEGQALDTVLARGVQEYYRARRISAIATIPFGQAVGAAAGGGLVYYCTLQDGLCDVLRVGGGPTSRFRIALAPVRRRVTNADWQRAIDDETNREARQADRTTLRAVLDEVPRPRTFPALDRIAADQAGRLWVRTLHNYGTEAASWAVVSASGALLALVALPRGLQPLDIGVDYFVGLTRDADGVERVSVRRLPLFP